MSLKELIAWPPELMRRRRARSLSICSSWVRPSFVSAGEDGEGVFCVAWSGSLTAVFPRSFGLSPELILEDALGFGRFDSVLLSERFLASRERDIVLVLSLAPLSSRIR